MDFLKRPLGKIWGLNVQIPMNQFLWLCPFLLLMGSCAEQTAPGELQQLAAQFHLLHCEQADLEIKVTALWDNVAQQLNAQLPQDMPAQEKHNMVSVRNAPLIRMFETYPGLDHSIQNMVDQAEMEDKKVVERLNEIKGKQHVLEQQRMELFGQIEKEQPEKLKAFRQFFEQIATGPCPSATQ